MQTDYQEEANALRKEADLHQNISSAIKNTFFRIDDDEFAFIEKGYDYQALAEHQIIDYLNVAPTLTAEEAQSSLDRISYNYFLMEWSFEKSRTFRLYDYFELEGNEDAFLLDIYPEFNNYEINVTATRYFSYQSPVEVLDAEEFLSSSLIDTGIIPAESSELITELVNNYYMPVEFISVDTGVILDIIVDILFEEMQIATDLGEQASDAEQIANRIAVGVSITTVASVLALAMSNRREDRLQDQQFSRLRADILKDETLVIDGSDWLSLIVLFVAAIIAMVGLVYPFVLAVF